MKRLQLAAWGAIGLLAIAGCSSDPKGEPPTPTPPSDITLLSDTDHLVRISMALKGTRPTIAELESVQADPSALDGIVDGYLASPEFGETIKEMHNEAWLVRAQNINFPAVDAFAGTPTGEINGSLSDAPMELIKYIVMNDRPYTEILTADYLLADANVATAWGVAHSGAPDSWEVSNWVNGQPAAGILTSAWTFVRHRSAGFNWNRGRANQISKALLCYDFLNSDIVIDGGIDLSDPDAINNAVQNNEACKSCHDNLDPLAGFFWGHLTIQPNQVTSYPMLPYNAGREGAWSGTSGTAPGYFGAPGVRLDDLADMIASDALFTQCTAQRFYAYLAEVQPGDVNGDLLDELYAEFLDSGYNARALTKAAVLADEFKVSHGATVEAADSAVGYKKVRPAQLARMIEDLTGFRWETDIGQFGTVSLPTSDLFGFRVLGGGIDSFFVTQPSHTVNATTSLYLRGFAAEAAGFVVETDFATADTSLRKLLSGVSATDTDESIIRDQLVNLHVRFYAQFVASDSLEVDDAYAVFADTLGRTGDPAHAWKTTLTAMLQDVRIAYY